MAEHQNVNDPDVGKGAVEGDGRDGSTRDGNTSLSGQNPHRTESNLVKSNDSDFPEPGGNPEHSGQKLEVDQQGRPHQPTGQRGSTLSHDSPGAMNESTRKTLGSESDRKEPAEGADARAPRSPERDQVNQDPGHRQKQNQADKKDDPLAA